MNTHPTRAHPPLTAPGESTPNLADLRDQILGPRRPSEDLEAYRLRGYQALRTARELASPNPTSSSEEDQQDRGEADDPILTGYHSKLDLIATSLNQPLDL